MTIAIETWRQHHLLPTPRRARIRLLVQSVNARTSRRFHRLKPWRRRKCVSSRCWNIVGSVIISRLLSSPFHRFRRLATLITRHPSLFQSSLKPPFSARPSHCSLLLVLLLLQDWLTDSPRWWNLRLVLTFCFLFSVFTLFSCRSRAVD